MSSNGGLVGLPGDPLYSAIKHGVLGLFLVSPHSTYVNGVGLAVDGAKAAGVCNADRYRTDFQLME